MSEDIGERLKAVRQKHDLSQRALAKRAGVTNGLISLIEQNRVSPSIASLKKVLDGIPISLAEFFTAEVTDQHKTFYQAGELPDLGKEGISYRLVGYDRHGRQMSILREVYEPGTDTGADMLTHEGEEGGVIVRGQIELTVGNEVRVLGPGDSYYFESKIPHRFRNVGDEPCEIVSANSPPSF
ncbi:MAG: cupin domain-containing protein [Permianibacter sp.]